MKKDSERKNEFETELREAEEKKISPEKQRRPQTQVLGTVCSSLCFMTVACQLEGFEEGIIQ